MHRTSISEPPQAPDFLPFYLKNVGFRQA